jgi:erythronate-4-phosphate dehydrogenase
VVLINTSRGEVIDEAALLAFQQANPKSTLILDVWCNEPKIDIQLLNHSFIGTPHIAGYSYDGKLKATKVLAEALQAETNITSHDLPVLASEAVADAIEYYDDNAIASAIMRSYDVRSDAIALGELSNMPIEAHAGYFDSLRKNYPIRREFTNREINTNKLNHELQQRLQDLGFQAGAA